MSQKPSRRHFMQMVGGSLLAGGQSGAQAQRRPNVLFVFSDQHRACSMPGEPYSDVEAPNLKRLVTEGTTFRNCISNYPVCSPYRGMLLSGRWPYQTGIIDNDFPLKPNEISLGKVFKRAGYHTGYIGKWHLQSRDTQSDFVTAGPQRQGFEDWQVWYNTNPHYDQSYTYDQHSGRKIQPSGFNATLMADSALKFIEENRARP
ncbi:sulfatase-like hydrolase/transferase, partial [Acidobacteria bacterium AH-259-A15]|nr:sulfatase-like hydrolase/transferase [Acidobacteria bacterium AH-259-A15]